jgi:hypothetical protein
MFGVSFENPRSCASYRPEPPNGHRFRSVAVPLPAPSYDNLSLQQVNLLLLLLFIHYYQKLLMDESGL